MSNENTALWRDMMEYLRCQHAPICRQWFEQLHPGELDGGLLMIHTTSSVQMNYLQKQCVTQFTEAAQAATGALVTVRFVNGRMQKTSHFSPLLDVPEPAAGGTGPLGTFTVPLRRKRAADGQALATPDTLDTSDTTQAALYSTSVTADEDWPSDQITISPDYSFNQFVTGPENALAYSAAVAVANKPGTTYNPLFIHGGVGLGKTHLLQAICQSLMEASPTLRICYLSCDSFVTQFLDCIQHNRMGLFRHRYRHVDLLVIDDIHFLSNRERTQEEFFHTFNELYQLNRQIVLSSDLPPQEIPQLEDRLVSRFQSGMVAPVTRPHYETRMAIVRAKSTLRGLELPDDVIAHIAACVDSNARELEGAITTLQGHAVLHRRPIDLAMAQHSLGEPVTGGRTSQVTLQQVVSAVTSYYSVRLSDLQSKRRHKSVTTPRQVCMWLVRRYTRYSLGEIGGHFGGRDHTTVMHSIRIIDKRMSSDSEFYQQIEQIKALVVDGTGLHNN